MKQLFYKLFFLLPIPFIIGLTNYELDNAHLFDSEEFLDSVINIIRLGKNVANIKNYDERLFQKKYIEQLTVAPEIIILGSSRVLQIGPKHLNNDNLFNHGVSGAVLQDILAIYYPYHHKKIKPKKIVLGLDPWILNKNNNEFRWQTIKGEYSKMIDFLQIKEHESKQKTYFSYEKNLVKELFSFKYFIESIKDRNQYCTPTIENISSNQILTTNGTRSYSYSTRQRSQKNINDLANIYGKGASISWLNNFEKIDPELKSNLLTLIQYLLKERIKITLYLPPFHPKTYKSIIDDDELLIVKKVEKYFREVGKKYGLEIIGSYDPDNIEFKEGDFYDGLHAKEESLLKLFKKSNL